MTVSKKTVFKCTTVNDLNETLLYIVTVLLHFSFYIKSISVKLFTKYKDYSVVSVTPSEDYH